MFRAIHLLVWHTLLILLLTCPSLGAELLPPSDLPDSLRTPGEVNKNINQDNIDMTICHKGWSTKNIRPTSSYTTKLKKHQLAEWHYKNKKTGDYEEDHLISLEIGGAPSDPKNLWPQPYKGEWGARTKDKLEDRLHKLVCDGTITLHEAQEAISKDWIAAYKKYVN